MAAPPAEHPVVSIDRLRDGTLTWSVRVPGASLPRAVDRAIQEAKRLQAELDAWQAQRESAQAKKAHERLVAAIERTGGGVTLERPA
jgi:hypothetical protein